MPAPIALFVYNRPLHTRRTVEALQRNDLAAASDLFIFSDAPRNEAARAAVEATRAFIGTVRGFRSVSIVFREANLGLAASIIDGVGTLCREHGHAIVLEDDLETSPHFLRFMNDALDLYRDDDAVMHVSGSTYPTQEIRGQESYFLRLPLCWGWATWARAWRHFQKDIAVMDKFDAAMVSRFNFDDTYDYWEQLEMNRSGRMNTWFVFWYATLFLRDGLSLFPRKSMVRNIGMDGTGVHCGATDDFDVALSASRIVPERIALEVSEIAFSNHKRYFRGLRPSVAQRGMRKARRILSRAWNGVMPRTLQSGTASARSAGSK